MTTNQLEDIAYKIATGNCLTESFSKSEYDAMTEDEVFVHVWQPFENFSTNELCNEIANLARLIIDNFQVFVKDED